MKKYHCFNKTLGLWVTEMYGQGRQVGSKRYWKKFMGDKHMFYKLVEVEK